MESPLQAGKASFGRLVSRSSSSVASSTDGDSTGKDQQQLQRQASEDAAAGAEPLAIRYSGIKSAAVCPEASPDAIDGRAVDAVLADGSDADLDTGAPLPDGKHDEQTSTMGMPASSRLHAHPVQPAPSEPGMPTAAQGIGHDAQAAVQQAPTAPAATAVGSAATAPDADALHAQHEPDGSGSVQPGVLLTAANLAKLDAQAQTAEDHGIRRLEGQLDDCGRCRIDKHTASDMQ